MAKNKEINTIPKAHVIWGTQLANWRKAVGLNQEFLASRLVNPKRNPYGVRIINYWEAGKKIPPLATIGQLVVFLYDQKVEDEGPDGQTESRKLWSEPEQVLDWLALVGHSQQDLLALPLDKTVKEWLKSATGPTQAWIPFPLPTDYVEQAEVETLVKTLKSMVDYRRPENRVTVLYGLPGSGTSTLAAAVLDHPDIRNYFRSGGQFLTEATIRWLEQEGQPPPPDRTGQLLRPVRNWWAWLEDEVTVGLVVIDGLTDTQLLARLLSRAGAQLRFLVTTTGSQVVLSGDSLPHREQVHYMPVGGLNPVVRLAEAAESWADGEVAADPVPFCRRPGGHRAVVPALSGILGRG